MIIAQISDTHIALDTEDSDQRIRDFEAVITDINNLDPQPDLIIHTGDIVHNGRQDEYETATGILSKAKAPVFAMVGNKDERLEMRSAFSSYGFLQENSEFTDFAIDDFPVRLICLDTLDSDSNKGSFCTTRIKQLNKMIDADDTRSIAVFTHHPPFEVLVGPESMHFGDETEMQNLREVLLNTGRVMGLFCGHVHRSTTGNIGSIPTFISTAVSTTLRKGEYHPRLEASPIYQILRHDGSNGFSVETRIAQ